MFEDGKSDSDKIGMMAVEEQEGCSVQGEVQLESETFRPIEK